MVAITRAAIRVSYAALSRAPIEGSCEFQDELGDFLRKTEVSFVCKVGNSLFVFNGL